MTAKNRRLLIVLGSLLALCCVCTLACLGVGAYQGYKIVREQAAFLLPEKIPQAIPELHLPPGPDDEDMLSLATSAEMPTRDLLDLGVRLKGLPPSIREPQSTTPPERRMGDRETFWIVNHSDPEDPRYFEAEAELRHISEHAYFWVEVDLDDPPTDEQLAEEGLAFDQIYDTNHGYFGTEWSPGIDGEERVHIYNGSVPGVGGYFSSTDEFPRSVNPHSNEREIFYVNLEILAPGTGLYSAVLAHEFQHMIRWHQKRSEYGWVDEGLSELAMTLNDHPTDGSELVFGLYPDTQLNAWTDEMGRSYVHYGASYLFLSYFFDRFGPELLQALADSPETGMAGFDEVLAGEGLSFDDLFRQWTVVNVLQEGQQRSLPYGNAKYASRHTPLRTEKRIARYPASGKGAVHQYGTDYLRLNPPKDQEVDLVIHFDGSSRTRLLPTTAQEGRAFWYSGRGNDRDITLTRAFDLRGVDQATLTFSTWYDIEDAWDFGYVEVSTDGGLTWDILRGPSSSDKNPMGNSFGWGYTGVSGGAKGDEPRWLEERIDLSHYAGQEILLRFEYITDDAYHAAGWALDEIAIPEIGYLDTAEDPETDWEARGFVRSTNFVPQRFSVQLIELAGSKTRVRQMPLDAENRGTLQLEGLGGEVTQAILVISAMTPITTEWGYYEYRIEPAGTTREQR